MNVDEFWKMNERLPVESSAQELGTRLQGLEPAEIASYQEHFDRCFNDAFKWNLWAAAYLIGGGCSDDGFIDFRYGLISRGKEVFEAAMVDPDSLADFGDAIDEETLFFEEFGYVASQVYESKVADPIPATDASNPDEPAGEEWDFDDERICKQKLPKLFAKFG